MAEKTLVHELSITDAAYAGTKITARKATGASGIVLVMKDTNFEGNSTRMNTIELRCDKADAHKLARHLLTL